MPSDLFPSSDGKKLDSALRGLHATPAAPLPFLSGVVVRSFILEREQGNVIVYNAPGITAARKRWANWLRFRSRFLVTRGT